MSFTKSCLLLVAAHLFFNGLNAFSLFPSKPKHEDGELILVEVLMRHGQRAPYGTYPGDPYQNYSYPEGYAGLSNEGKSMLFQYGQVLAERYKDYFGKLI